jgi:hypothetical protein
MSLVFMKNCRFSSSEIDAIHQRLPRARIFIGASQQISAVGFAPSAVKFSLIEVSVARASRPVLTARHGQL